MKNAKTYLLGWAYLFPILASAQTVIPSTVEISELRICWDSAPATMYQVQYQSTPSGPWINLGSQVTASSAQTCIGDAYVPDRSYRVIVPEMPPVPSTMAW